MKNNNIIGKQYVVKDNSYSSNLTTAKDRDYKIPLAPRLVNNFEVKYCTILTNPFNMIINQTYSGPTEFQFVIVEYNKQVYCVLYDEKTLNNN